MPAMVSSSATKLSWKKIAHRSEGRNGYVFGDFTAGVAQTLLSSARRLIQGKNPLKIPFKADLPPSHMASSLPEENASVTQFVHIPEDQVKRIKRVGEGASSTVYKSKWRGAVVAEKMLFIDDTDESRFRTMKEISILSKIRHPNIIQLIGAFCSCELLCIYSEFAEHGSLYNLLHDKNVPVSGDVMRRWALEVGFAISFIHDFEVTGIVHRDIKSPNVLMFPLQDFEGAACERQYSHLPAEQLTTKLCDFGVAHHADISTCGFEVCPDGGTIRWMAPEAITHDPSEFSSKTDVYGFGMLLYELNTRQLPYGELEWQQIMMAVALHNARPEMPDFVPTDFRTIIEMCWAVDPKVRPNMPHVLDMLKVASMELVSTRLLKANEEETDVDEQEQIGHIVDLE